jgi:poly-beta-1,6-N-acetyl-D-glucosamine synthase
MIFIFVILYLIFSAFSIIGILKYKKGKLKQDNPTPISLTDIHLIIPFRNEENRINGLIQSLNNSEFLPNQITFIDDHSTDKTCEVIQSNLKTRDFQILSLPQTEKGKKAAIRFGIDSNKDLPYILTFDADINFGQDYFKNIETLQSSDLLILPVVMTGKSIFHSLFAFDYNLLSLINRITTGWFRPILVSGANLLFKKKQFLDIDSYVNHQHIASGDDMFLLKDFIENKKVVQLISDSKHNVYTSAPENYYEFISQRIRWSNKTKTIDDKVSNQILILNVFILSAFYVSLFICFYLQIWKLSVMLFLFKNIIDVTILFIDNNGTTIKKSYLMPIYSIFQPFYYLSIFIGLIFINVKWKDRKIKA